MASPRFTSRDLFFVMSLLAITTLVVVFGKSVTFQRSKAYQQTEIGVRIEAEEMTVSGSVTKDTANGFVTF